MGYTVIAIRFGFLLCLYRYNYVICPALICLLHRNPDIDRTLFMRCHIAFLVYADDARIRADINQFTWRSSIGIRYFGI